VGVLTRIMGEPPKLFANQAMLKPPGIGREKPWHQDHAYFNLPMDTCIVSAWVALDNATPENGCMHVIPASQQDGPVVHFNRRDWQICDTDIARDRIVAVPLEPGGVLLWHGRLHHGSPANRSDKRRRALQLHYVPGSVETIAPDERLAVYGSDGKDVTC
jgi:phytanoyl-CoA hydroxylase